MEGGAAAAAAVPGAKPGARAEHDPRLRDPVDEGHGDEGQKAKLLAFLERNLPASKRSADGETLPAFQ